MPVPRHPPKHPPRLPPKPPAQTSVQTARPVPAHHDLDTSPRPAYGLPDSATHRRPLFIPVFSSISTSGFVNTQCEAASDHAADFMSDSGMQRCPHHGLRKHGRMRDALQEQTRRNPWFSTCPCNESSSPWIPPDPFRADRLTSRSNEGPGKHAFRGTTGTDDTADRRAADAGAGTAVAAGSSGPQSERAGDRRFLIRLSLDRRAGRGVQSHRAPRPFHTLSARPARARFQATAPRHSYH